MSYCPPAGPCCWPRARARLTCCFRWRRPAGPGTSTCSACTPRRLVSRTRRRHAGLVAADQLATFRRGAGSALDAALAIRSATPNRACRAFGGPTSRDHGGDGGRHREPLDPRHHTSAAVVASRLVRRGSPRSSRNRPSWRDRRERASNRCRSCPQRRKPYMRIRSAVATVATLALAVRNRRHLGGLRRRPRRATDGSERRGDGRDERRTTAEQALEDAELLFDADPETMPSGDRDATLVLRDLALHRNRLDGAQRATANRLLARPGAQKSKCAKHVCVHWSSSGPNRVAAKDRRPQRHPRLRRQGAQDHGEGAPDVRAGRLPRPQDGHRQGGNRKRDVYLGNIGPAGPVRLLHHRPGGARHLGVLRARQRLRAARSSPRTLPGEHARDGRARVLPRGAVRLRLLRGRLVMEATATWAGGCSTPSTTT